MSYLGHYLGWQCPCCNVVWNPQKESCDCQVAAKKSNQDQMQAGFVTGSSLPSHDYYGGGGGGGGGGAGQYGVAPG